MTNIQNFLNTFEVFLHSFELPHYSTFPDILQQSDSKYSSYIFTACSEFITVYIRANLDENTKIKIIEEYGMKRLIDLHCQYEGNSICLELLHLHEHIDKWIHILFMNVIKLY